MRIFWIIAFVWAALVSPSGAQMLVSADFEDNAGTTRVELSFDAPVTETPRFFAVDDGAPRYVADFDKASANIKGENIGNGQIRIAGQGAVQSMRYARRGTDGLRLVFDLMPGVTVTEQAINETQVSLTLDGGLTASGNQAALLPESGLREFSGMPYPRLAPGRKPVFRPIIVIDPGHGGYDPGALGSGGTKEKTLTLKAAKELQKQLLATGRYRVMLTRHDDSYVEHEERLRIARAGQADLFISIHADSAGNSSARGASVYTLSDRSKGRSKGVIDTQNWVMDVDLTQQSDPVGNILVDLAQRKTASQSAQFADVLLPKLRDTTHMVGNSHRRAGYYVLLAPDVPAVLLEMGFLSNSGDEKLLKTETHRKKMMKAVTTAINTYFDKETG